MRLYQWYALMVKLQGVGAYARRFPLDFDSEPVQIYARESNILMDFFKTLRDYTALDIASDKIEKAPGKFHLALVSDREIVVYLHTDGFGKTIPEGESLILKNLDIPDGPVTIRRLNPATGAASASPGAISKHQITISLPGFTEDLAFHLTKD